MASIIIVAMMGTRMLDKTRNALALINWFGSLLEKFWTKLEWEILSKKNQKKYFQSSLKSTDAQERQILLLFGVSH